MGTKVNITIDGKKHTITSGVHPFAELAGLVGEKTHTVTTRAVQLVPSPVLVLASGNRVTITGDSYHFDHPATPQDQAEVEQKVAALAAPDAPKPAAVGGNDSVNIAGGEIFTSVQG